MTAVECNNLVMRVCAGMQQSKKQRCIAFRAASVTCMDVDADYAVEDSGAAQPYRVAASSDSDPAPVFRFKGVLIT